MTTRLLALVPAIFAVLLLIGWASSPAAHANAALETVACYSFSGNIKLGQQDNDASQDVDSLQHFLVSGGYFETKNLGTGHFGPLTMRAVQSFQKAYDLPTTGFFGPLSRAAAIKAQVHCGGPISIAPALYSLSTTSGPIGTQVSIRGFGFSDSNTVLIDGLSAARDVPISSSMALSCTTDPACHGGINQTITFTIPSSVSPYCSVGFACPLYARMLDIGEVSITVRNSDLSEATTSNSLSFKITK